MARYYASAGIRHIQASSEKIDTYPFLVIIGPSGQCAQVHGPSGVGGTAFTSAKNFEAYEQTPNHKCLAFYKNEILCSLRNAIGTLRANYGFSWMPYGMPAEAKVNPAANPIVDENGNASASRVIMDGRNWKKWAPQMTDWYKEHFAFLKIPGGKLFWCFPTYQETLTYGFYDGKNPVYKVVGSTSGWKCRSGIYFAGNFQVGADKVNTYTYGGVHRDIDTVGTGPSSSICDIAYYKGTIFIAFLDKIVGLVPGGKGNFVWHDNVDDTDVDSKSLGNDVTVTTNTYTSRRSNDAYGGSQNRVFTEHKGTLYMLQADGKLFTVNAGGIQQVANLASIGTPWSSGIYGGYTREANQTAWGGSALGYRPYMASFNNQLHAFLNFRSTYKLAAGKGTDGDKTLGRGVFWATSHDGIHWSDRTDKLPSSGIIPNSGALSPWLSEITPYQFSAFVGYDRSQNTVWEAQASGFAKSWTPCRPSGFTQANWIPWFESSGVMVDSEGTAFGSLQVPLSKGVIGKYLFPTWVQYPSTYSYISGVFQPRLCACSGYDYTGCHNYHMSGHTDEDRKKLRLMFSQDFTGGHTLIYDLTKASGWNQINYLPKSKQLNGLIPIDLYDPEVLIPSGDMYNPNPRIDEVNKQITTDFYVYDWPFWSPVHVDFEYSIDDGQTWAFAGRQKDLSTGSLATDPSGVLGVKYTWTWNYMDKLSKNLDYNRVQLRARATEV